MILRLGDVLLCYKLIAVAAATQAVLVGTRLPLAC